MSLLFWAGLALAAPQAGNATFPVELAERLMDAGLDVGADLQAEPLIINGEEASAADYPATVALVVDIQFRYGGSPYHLYNFGCTGTLIAPDTVLTAAHCVDETVYAISLAQQGITLDALDFAVTFEPDLTDWDGTSHTTGYPDDAVEVADFVMHERFNIMQIQTGLAKNWDIALLFLEEQVDDIDFVYLPTADEAATIEEGLEVMVVGWGQQENVAYGQQPRSGTYAIKMMGESYINALEDYEFQVGGEEEDVRKCKGDSGGPSYAWYDDASTMRVIGVTSHAWGANPDTLCEEDGGVDTRVDYYLDWLEEELVAGCDDGVRTYCDEPGIPEPNATEDTDTDGSSDTDTDGNGGGDEGCNCAAGGGAGGLSVLWLGLVAVARRRR